MWLLGHDETEAGHVQAEEAETVEPAIFCDVKDIEAFSWEFTLHLRGTLSYISLHTFISIGLVLLILGGKIVARHLLILRPNRVGDLLIGHLFECRLVGLISFLEDVFLDEIDS